jgi:hypothetical protein
MTLARPLAVAAVPSLRRLQCKTFASRAIANEVAPVHRSLADPEELRPLLLIARPPGLAPCPRLVELLFGDRGYVKLRVLSDLGELWYRG